MQGKPLMESHFLLVFLLILGVSRAANGAIFTLVNNCGYTVWPGILSNAGSAKMATTGFELATGTSQSLQAPTGWSGRLWGRTECRFDDSGRGSCRTGDCGSGTVECGGSGAAPPATLAEFTLGGAGGQDFYDVSLVDGYNLPMVVSAVSGSTTVSTAGSCAMTGCAADLNQRCPPELRVTGDSADTVACRSACEAFGRPEFCCSGDFANPNTCKPSYYAGIFKSACPRAYSYAYDDATSTFTCANADYTITFCPNLASQKSSMDSISSWSSSSSSASNPRATTGVILSDEGWLASVATADASSTRVGPWRVFSYTVIAFIVTIVGMIL